MIKKVLNITEHGEMSSLHKSCLSPTSMLRIVVNDQRTSDGGNQLNYRVHQDDNASHHHHRRSSDSDAHSHDHESDDEFITNIKITPTMFLNMCPALLLQIEQGACSEVTKVELGKEQKAFTMGKLTGLFSNTSSYNIFLQLGFMQQYRLR